MTSPSQSEKPKYLMIMASESEWAVAEGGQNVFGKGHVVIVNLEVGANTRRTSSNGLICGRYRYFVPTSCDNFSIIVLW